MRKSLLAIALTALAVLVIAGCGGSSGPSYGSSGEESESSSASASGTSAGGYSSRYGASSGSSEGGGSTSTSGGGAATVSLGSASGVGKVLVDSNGMTLYMFEKDKGGKSSCSGSCASAWPPLTTGGAPKATAGVQASKLGTTKRSDGTTQVTYAGFPLYTFTSDSKPGEAKGTDVKSFGASWYPLQANGQNAGS